MQTGISGWRRGIIAGILGLAVAVMLWIIIGRAPHSYVRITGVDSAGLLMYAADHPVAAMVMQNGTHDVGTETIARLVAFARDRQPFGEIRRTPSPDDTVTVSFGQQPLLPVTVWVLAGNFSERRRLALYELLTANAIYRNYCGGFRLYPDTIVDRTGDATARALASNFCSPSVAELTRCGIYRPGEINIYYVERVCYDSTRGHTSRSDSGMNIISMASLCSDVVLAHEIGHALGLPHFRPQAQDAYYNVMTASGFFRMTVTAGQTFLAHFSPESSMQKIYHVGAPPPVGMTYPPDTLRIWSGVPDFFGHR